MKLQFKELCCHWQLENGFGFFLLSMGLVAALNVIDNALGRTGVKCILLSLFSPKLLN